MRQSPVRSEDGFVLVIVLIIIALLFPIIIAFNSRTQINLIEASNYRDNIQAIRMARSGVEGAMGVLMEDDASYDALTDRWAMDFPSFQVGEGMLAVKITDEDSKININRLVDGGNINSVVDGHLRKLIVRLEGKPEIVDALIDWMDTDDKVYGTAGAEEEYYRELGYYPKNGALSSLDELLLIKGFDKDLLIDKKLKEYITVSPTDGKLNINTADIETLYDFHDEIREGLVEEIINYRNENEYKNTADVKGAIGITDTLFSKIVPFIKVNSSIFLVNSRYTIGKVTKRVEAVIKRDGKIMSIISWREF
jgi:general secretion pathway protein K